MISHHIYSENLTQCPKVKDGVLFRNFSADKKFQLYAGKPAKNKITFLFFVLATFFLDKYSTPRSQKIDYFIRQLNC